MESWKQNEIKYFKWKYFDCEFKSKYVFVCICMVEIRHGEHITSIVIHVCVGYILFTLCRQLKRIRYQRENSLAWNERGEQKWKEEQEHRLCHFRAGVSCIFRIDKWGRDRDREQLWEFSSIWHSLFVDTFYYAMLWHSWSNLRVKNYGLTEVLANGIVVKLILMPIQQFCQT